MEATLATPIFIALEPDDATTNSIWRYKHRVRELVGDQLYLDHPPHLTFYLAAFGNVEEVLEHSRLVVRALSAPALHISGWHVFFSDPLTGNHTLVLDFVESDREQLRDMQACIVDSLGPLHDDEASLERINGQWSQLKDDEKAAASRHGFPYIGTGWHPHFTIASIRPEDWSVIERELLCNSPEGSLSCPRIQAFRLIDGEPELLESFNLRREAEIEPPLSKPSAMRGLLLPGVSGTLKDDLIEAIWSVVDRHNWILSATLTGSFLTDQTLDAISDIDLVVIVEELNGPRFDGLQQEFTAALTPSLAGHGLKLLINPTLGPRKLNDEATAVLHLMLYSREAHHQHAIKSPFTCLDWQRSAVYRKRSMADIYPVFGLQPHHFVSARRGLRDYLHDFERGVVSYREIECSVDRCSESRREEPMTTRDRYEYAYHVMRFLMQNLIKLVRRTNRISDGDALAQEYSSVFPHEAAAYQNLYQELRWRKAQRDFSKPISNLGERLCSFVLNFESQFRVLFAETATRHVFFRHAPTKLNQPTEERIYQGRTDISIEPVSAEELANLIEEITDFAIDSVYSSPLHRCRQSLEQVRSHVALPATIEDARLVEIDYGACEGLSVSQAKVEYANLFCAWAKGEDPQFPDGENTADVLARLNDFLERSDRISAGNSIVCTHNVVLRCLVGKGLGVPQEQWHRIHVPHLAPISVVQTRDYGWFVDLEESVERRLFANFLHSPMEAK